jgi:uncharacterized membrane protein YedE/YeeE
MGPQFMDAFAFPVAFVATILVAATARWGIALHREELRTGLEPKSYNWFLVFLIGGGGMIFYLGAVREIAFFFSLMATLLGAFIALAAIHFGLAGLRLLTAGRQASSRQGPTD